jgi:hypothetical protein
MALRDKDGSFPCLPAFFTNVRRTREEIPMLPREYGAESHDLPTLPQGTFTPAEIARLEALRKHYRTHPEPIGASIDVCRLKFARWLVQHGRLSEGPWDDEPR